MDKIVFTQTRRYLKDVSRMYRPNRKLFLALDGPASLLKLSEQRKRRRDAALTAERTGLVDAQQFTPGCTFMTRLETMLQEFGHNSLAEKVTNPLDYVISGVNALGEGETKIFHDIAAHRLRPASYAILTTDSDAMLHTIGYAVPHAFIVPPPWELGRTQTVLATDVLLKLLKEESKREQKHMAVDFCFLVSLSGNDYLPGMQFGNFASLWPIYCKHPQLYLIEPSTGQLRIEDFYNLLTLYMDSAHFISHRGLQEALLAVARMNPIQTHERIVSFLNGALAVTNQSTGFSQNTTISLEYPYPCAPSVGEVVHFLTDKVIGSGLIAWKDPPTEPQLTPLAAAIMMLDLNERSIGYLPESVRELAKEYQLKQFSDDQQALTWLNLQFHHQGLLELNESASSRNTCEMHLKISTGNTRNILRYKTLTRNS